MKWRSALVWVAAIDAGLFAAIGIHDVDREAIAFAVLYIAGLALLQLGRRGILGVILIGLLSLDTEFWMATATVSNLQNGESLIAVAQPLAVAIATAVTLIAVVGTLITREPRSGHRLWTVAGLGLAVFVVGFAGEALLASSALQARSGSLQLNIHNAAYSTKTLTAGSGQATVSIANQDLFWHTFTIDKLGVNVLVPVGGHRELSLNLAPGTYIYYCAIPGHRQAGMQGTLTVR
ncbi:MAG: hypothetical protein E6I88_03420 [Chloroflexi bacterium]|nr:MAG: hypothetical protein E6I88_03420 [Chloroflexota bacterium]TME45152.1 MAG: hypothetical protein E6I56_10145 [Chloroflexota bacterium]